MYDIVKWLLLILLFSPVFYFAFRQKKWYLYLSCAFIGILPDQFAIELHASLPLLTAQRLLILLLLGFWIVKKCKNRQFSFPVILVVYAALNILVSVVNIRYGLGGEIKRVAILLLEQVLLVIMMIELIDGRKELNLCLDAMILSCCALSVVGMIQTIFEVDVASVLKLVDARTATELTPRMGMVRAFGTTNAIIFGCYCAFMSLLIYYRLERTNKQRYAVAMALTLSAMICTLSRGAWLCFGAILVLLLCIRPKKLLRPLGTSLLMTLVLCLLLGFFGNRHFLVASIETGRSTANTVLGVVDLEIPALPGLGNLLPQEQPMEENPDTEEPEGSDTPEFGKNESSAAQSRLVEWTAAQYMFDEGNGLFGYGYNAFTRGKLHYFYPQFGFWTVAGTLDVGLLKVMTESGLVGFLAYLSLLGFSLFMALKHRGKRGLLTFEKLFAFLLVEYLLLNFMAAFTGPFWLALGLFYASLKLTKKEEPEIEELPEKGWQF